MSDDNQSGQQPAAPAAPQLTHEQQTALGLLAKREKAVREAEAALKKQEALVTQARTVLGMAKQDPMGLLRKLGVDPAKVKATDEDPVAPIREQMSAFQKQLEDTRSYLEQQAMERARLDAKASLQSFIGGSNEYPLIQAMGMEEAVFQQIQAHYDSTGQELSNAEAAKMVEAQLQNVVGNLEKAGYVSKKDSPSNEATSQDVATLTNDLSSETSLVPKEEPPTGWVSDDDALQKAASLLQFTEEAE